MCSMVTFFVKEELKEGCCEASIYVTKCSLKEWEQTMMAIYGKRSSDK